MHKVWSSPQGAHSLGRQTKRYSPVKRYSNTGRILSGSGEGMKEGEGKLWVES